MAKNLILWLVIAVVLMSVFQSFSPGQNAGSRLAYSEFLKQVDNGNVRRADFGEDGRTITVMTRNGQSYKTVIPTQSDPKIVDQLANKNVEFSGTPPEEPSILTSIFISWFPMLLLIGVRRPRAN